MVTLKVSKSAADFYLTGDEKFPLHPTVWTYMDTYIGVRVVVSMFSRLNGSVDTISWSKWKDSLNL